MKQRLKSQLTGDILYFISFGLFLVSSILSTSFFYKHFLGTPYSHLQMLCMGLLLVYEILSNRGRQNWIGLAVCAALFAITKRVSVEGTQQQVVMMFAYIYCARNIPFAKIARFTLNVSIVTVLGVVLSSYFGLVQNIAASKNGRVRDDLGFRYALFLPGILLNMTALWVYITLPT